MTLLLIRRPLSHNFPSPARKKNNLRILEEWNGLWL